MASVRGAIENAKAIINDKRTKNSMDVLGEQVVINDDEIMEGGIHLTDSSNRISFKKKYFPDLTDNLLVDAIKVFKKVFGGRFPLTLTEHNPPCSEDDFQVIIDGLVNRFQTLSNDIHSLNVQKHDAEQIRTKMGQLQKLRNFLYEFQQKKLDNLCTLYDEDGSGDFTYNQINDKLRKKLVKFIMYSLYSFADENDTNIDDQFFSTNLAQHISRLQILEPYDILFDDIPATNIDESDIPDFLTKWKSIQTNNQTLPGLVVQLLQTTGNTNYNDKTTQQNLQLQKIKDSINRILGRPNTQTQAGGAIQIESLANLPNDLKEQINTIVSSSTDEGELVVNILAAVDKSYSELNKKNQLKNGELSNVIEFNEKYKEESEMTNEQLQTTSAELEKHANTNKELSDKNAELLVIKDKLEKINADQTQKLEELKTRFKGLIDMLNTHNKGLVDSTNNEIQSKVDSISKGSTEEVNKRLSELIQHILNSLETHIGKVNDVEASVAEPPVAEPPVAEPPVAEPPPPTGGGKKRKIDIKQAIKYCKERLNPLTTLLTNIEKSVQNGALDAKKAKLKALNELIKDSPNKTPIKTQIQTLKSEIYKLKNTDTSIEGLLANMCE